MSLTPGYILTDRDNVVGVTLPELAAIVAEWDRAHSWPRDVRSSEPELLLKGDRPQLCVRWYGYGTVTRLVLDRGESTAYLEASDIAEMRAVLAAQGAA
ncbi:MAG: hypothetical protein IPL19_21620 [Sandaracinaceae bacterium]|nr:hypothetical protein [Sandaracinaceae bacterium]